MKEDQKKVYNLFAKVISHGVHSFEIQPNSNIIINFIQDLETKAAKTENPWYFWFYTAVWQVELKDQILATSNDNKAKMQSVISQLECKKLLNVEVPSDKYDVKLMFEDDMVFHLMAEDYRDCNVAVKIQKLIV